MNCTFSSPIASCIQSYLAKRENFGYNILVEKSTLRKLDMMWLDHFPNENILTQEIAEAWMDLHAVRNRKTLEGYICTMRVFARYLNSIGVDAYVLPFGITKKPQKYIPHIYTFDELTRLFREIDSMKYTYHAKVKHLVLPVLFRVIYCCGMRPVEAFRLENENIDLSTGTIRIQESKGHRSRLVMMSEDLLNLCRQYHKKVNTIYPHSKYFFPSCKGENCYSSRTLIPFFSTILSNAGIIGRMGRRPRIYDLRHTFATHCLYQWVKNGEDINSMLPFLSEYMGHICLESTAYYVHLVPDFFSEIDTVSLDKFSHLLPEVHDG